MFDREQVKKHKEYSLQCENKDETTRYDYVKNIIADGIVDRMSVCYEMVFLKIIIQN